MVVQHNITAMNSNRTLGLTTTAQAKSTEKLSSGYKINRAADDAAGLSISEKMRKQIRGLTQASSNAQDGISMVQTAEGALGEVHDMLQRMNELAVKAANGSMSTNDTIDVQREVNQLLSEINRVATTTKFNETYLLNGQANGVRSSSVDTSQVVKLHVGADHYDDNKINITLSGMSATKLGINNLSVSDENSAEQAHTNATNAISQIDAAIKRVSKQRSELGAAQNRLEHTIKNLDNVVENTTAAESEIRDTDMASEMVNYSKNNILAQAGQSMLAQANQSNQGVLSLLG